MGCNAECPLCVLKDQEITRLNKINAGLQDQIVSLATKLSLKESENKISETVSCWSCGGGMKGKTSSWILTMMCLRVQAFVAISWAGADIEKEKISRVYKFNETTGVKICFDFHSVVAQLMKSLINMKILAKSWRIWLGSGLGWHLE